jgi:carboxypeptidase C (cathepsin A)
MRHTLIKTISPLLFLTSALSHAQEKPANDEKNPPVVEEKAVEPIQKKASVKIDGKEIAYVSTVGKMILKNKKGEPRASIFYTCYTRENTADVSKRPVMFAFNGGPGSSAVWLHLGILGPRILDLPGDGTQPVTPPARLIDNDQSILDVCDLVFIDPVTTGYSRAAGKADEKEFHGIKEDIESVGDFIRMWITHNQRWSSPKYLCGESYGGIRAAGLADHLQERYGMSLNGVIMLSSLLDFRTLIPSQGSQLSYQIYLPTFATTALHHGKIKGERDAVYQAAREFAYGDYTLALLKGNEIKTEEFEKTAAKLAELTGISAEIWKKHQLRIDSSTFRAELLRAEGKVIGRFDARVAWDVTDPASSSAEYDPSYSLAYQAFSTAMLTYLGDELGWKEDQPYEILTNVSPWNYGADNRIVNLTTSLATALRDNPKLKVLVMGAHTDLATPPEGVSYSLRQLTGMSPTLLQQVKYTYYDAGHMFYTNPADLKKSRKDLVEFLNFQSLNPKSQ